MKTYELEDSSTGLILTVESDKEPSEQDVEQIFATDRREGISALARGYEKVRQTMGRQKYKKMPTDKFLKKYVPQALGIPSKDFDLSRGLPSGLSGLSSNKSFEKKLLGMKDVNIGGLLRAAIGFDKPTRYSLSYLRDPSMKTHLLKKEYGDENVKIINFGGTQEHLFKDKDGKWRMVDPKGVVEFADFTSDLAGEVFPTVAGIVSGLAATPSSVATTGPAAPLLIATASAGGEFSAGTMQDYIAQKIFGFDADASEILKKRSTDFLSNFATEFGAMKILPLAPNVFVTKKSYDISTQDAEFLSKAVPQKIPKKLYHGEKMANKVTEIASKYPDSTVAKHLDKMKSSILELGESAVGDPNLSKEISDKALTDILNDLNKKRLAQIDSLQNITEEILIKKSAIKQLPKESALKAKAKVDATNLFNEQRKRLEWSLNLPEEVPFEKLGEVYQNQLSKSYLKANKVKSDLYDVAYDEIGDVFIRGGKLKDAFDFIKENSLVDVEGELINSLNSMAVQKGTKTFKDLEDLLDLKIPFRSLNELIQSLRSKAGLSKTVASFDELKYQKIVKNLESIREQMLFSSGDSAKVAFNRAQDFYREKFLPYTSGRIGNSLKLRIGQNWNESKKAFYSGAEEIPLPIFEKNGTDFLMSALSDSSSLRDFLEFTEDKFGAKELLKKAFLQKKGLNAGSPINVSALDFNSTDKTIVRELWGDDKLKTFESLRNFAKDKDNYIDGISNDLFLKLTSTNNLDAEKELLKLAAKEVSVKKQIKELNANALKKLFDKGALIEDSSLAADLVINSLDNLSVPELKTIKKQLLSASSKNESNLKNSTWNYLLKRANQGKADAQTGFRGALLWNPKRMSDILDKNEIKYRILLGDKSFDYLKSLNGGLNLISTTKTTGKSGDLGLGMAGGLGGGDSAGGFTSYISNIPSYMQNVYSKMMLAADIKMPIPKVLLDPVKFDDLQSKLIKSAFISSKGLDAYFSEAENDPRVAKQLTEEYKQLLDISFGSKSFSDN